jgi:UDP-N-acetylglucosamine 4,6-dehydratase/5-epimerase
MSLNNKSILITGGTGSFGSEFIKYATTNFKKIKKLVIFSRDELKQFELAKIYSPKKYKYMRYFIGDVRDKDRLNMALNDIDYVVHAAAMKQVPTAEYNPIEAIKTNIIGAQNIIESALVNKVEKIISLSTDKAAAPINLYGATKLCSDKLFLAANNIKGNNKITFSVVRYGNVLGSRGSVIPEFIQQVKKNNELNVTDKRMTRFSISLKESVKMVVWSLKNCIGGETVIPKIPSYRIMDLAKAIGPSAKINFIGIRAGEKIHEELITSNDSFNTYDIGKYFIILNSNQPKEQIFYKKKFNSKKVKEGFNYNSKENNKFLSQKEIKDLIEKELK